MTTVVSVAQGGTGSNSAALARTALGVPPSAAYDQANTARDQANTARTQANAAYAQANSAYSDANTRLSASGGTLAGDLIITGNLTVSGNSTTLNAEILTIEDADIVLLSNVASTPALNAGIIVNRGTSTNTFIRWAENVDEWGWSDNGTTTYFFDDLRQGLITTNTTFGTVNTNITNTNSNAINAYAQANAAYGAANNRVLKAGDTMTGQLNISAGGLLVTGNSNFDSGTLFVDSVNDRIGIGTTTAPTSGGFTDSRVLIKQAANGITGGALQIEESGSDRVAFFGFTGSSFRIGTSYRSTDTYHPIQFTPGGTTASLHLATDGTVGIGTTSPSAKLHVAGTNNNAVGSSTFWNFNFVGQEITNLSNTAGTVSGLALIGGSGRSAVAAIGGVLETTALSSLAFFTGGSGVSGGTVPERMRITSGGNVGVGTTSPQSKLEVATSSGQFAHFGATSTANGEFTGITLGYRENNSFYRKAAIVQEQIGDNSARGHLHLLVDIANDSGTVVLGDSKFMIHGTTGKVGVGTSSFNTNGGKLQVADGISFPATQSACSDANTLDDYEEGTWTPELRDGGTVLTQGYSYRSGVYHKIGRMVHVHFGFLLSSLSGTSTGALRVYGLPFTGATTGGYQEPMGYAIIGNQPTASHSNLVYFFNMSGTAILEARLLTGVDTVYTSDNIDGDTFMKFSMIYWV